MKKFELRPASSIWIGITSLIVLGLASWAQIYAYGFASFIGILPVMALAASITATLFLRPKAIVDEFGVIAINPFRTLRIPWSQIVDVETRFGLVVLTATTRFRVSAGVAPGRHTVARADKESFKHIGGIQTKGAGFIFPGDILESDSGALAQVIRGQLSAIGSDETKVGGDEITVEWHWLTICGLVLLSGLTVAVIVFP